MFDNGRNDGMKKVVNTRQYRLNSSLGTSLNIAYMSVLKVAMRVRNFFLSWPGDIWEYWIP